MALPKTHILCINCGSSSLKFSIYTSVHLKQKLSGAAEGIGTPQASFKITGDDGQLLELSQAGGDSIDSAVVALAAWLELHAGEFPIAAIGHRIVQGGQQHRAPELINDALVAALNEIIYLAPNHLPSALEAIKVFRTHFPGVQQVACFDTFFHKDLPECATTYALPEKYAAQGLMKYGFHGLSYEYIMQKLVKKQPSAKHKKIIIAHLGNGASMAAIHHGKCVDTTMGLTPLGGLVMSSRPGDMDPGVLLFLLMQAKLAPLELDHLLSKESGLKAIAGTGNVQDLLLNQTIDPKADKALALFIYAAKKFIGSLAVVMGGLDMLVFTGGIGENSAEIRERICTDLKFLGIGIDKNSNHKSDHTISGKHGKVKVLVMKTNEDLVIAQHTNEITHPNK